MRCKKNFFTSLHHEMWNLLARNTKDVLLLLSCSLPSCLSFCSTACNIYVGRNRDFTVQLNYKLKGSELLRWSHNKKVVFEREGNNIISGKEDNIYENGSLALGKMNEEKTGEYTPEVYEDGTKKVNLKSTYICVMGRQAECSSLCLLIFTFMCLYLCHYESEADQIFSA